MSLNRFAPVLPPTAMKTYQVKAPISTHTRKATCAEVNCPALANGWRTEIDETTDLGKRQAWYIRNQSGRRYTEDRRATLTIFTFSAGQTCFAVHREPLEREPLYLVRGGDWRGNPRGIPTRQHVRAEDWLDDFATHQQTLADRLAQG
jgi:hypothetical protein